jgi:hypothetical protein
MLYHDASTVIIFDLTGQPFDTSSAVHFRSSPKVLPDRIVPAFSINVHYRSSLWRFETCS